MRVSERATLLGGFAALPQRDIFDVEYWDLEQAKLRKAGKPCVEALLARGAAVVGLDVNGRIESLHRRSDFLGIRCDVTSTEQIATALDATVQAFGGLDILVLNAGIF